MKKIIEKEIKILQPVPSSGIYHRCKFESTIFIRNDLVDYENILITNLVSLLHQIELLKLERLWLLSITSDFSAERKKIIKEEQDILQPKVAKIIDFQRRVKRALPILDNYIDSNALPIKRNKEGEWIHTRRKMVFDYTKTFARAEVARHMIELAADAITMCSSMRDYLLEERLNVWAVDVSKNVYEIQAKLLLLQKVFLSTREEWLFYKFETMAIDLEIIKTIKQCIHNFVFAKTKEISVLSSNAVANAYLFHCLELELRVQLDHFIRLVNYWKSREIVSLGKIDAFTRFELEFYDAEEGKKVKRDTRVINLLMMLQNEQDENGLFQQEQKARQLIGGNRFVELPIILICTRSTIDGDEKTRMPEFSWLYCWTWNEEWQNLTKKFEQQQDLLEQKVEELEEQLYKKNFAKEDLKKISKKIKGKSPKQKCKRKLFRQKLYKIDKKNKGTNTKYIGIKKVFYIALFFISLLLLIIYGFEKFFSKTTKKKKKNQKTTTSFFTINN